MHYENQRDFAQGFLRIFVDANWVYIIVTPSKNGIAAACFNFLQLLRNLFERSYVYDHPKYKQIVRYFSHTITRVGYGGKSDPHFDIFFL